ncbi:hypothetical protein G6F50_017279 [Rhizopus delemar]|uniref:Uncharacterized protein n=1 Tax=Rhizopus delemar TaxID=936053 RepID=A0A9P6XQH3_9FUNG|nr:hypothetical protein G6F50_017279 [Rhizopus delemar]
MHAALHAAHEGLAFIAAEIVADAGPQQGVDLVLGGFQPAALWPLGRGVVQVVQMPQPGREINQFHAHLIGRHDEVHQAGGDRAGGHFRAARPEPVGRLRQARRPPTIRRAPAREP